MPPEVGPTRRRTWTSSGICRSAPEQKPHGGTVENGGHGEEDSHADQSHQGGHGDARGGAHVGQAGGEAGPGPRSDDRRRGPGEQRAPGTGKGFGTGGPTQHRGEPTTGHSHPYRRPHSERSHGPRAWQGDDERDV